jgi:hypothetical protein
MNHEVIYRRKSQWSVSYLYGVPIMTGAMSTFIQLCALGSVVVG